jgi:hypothetical protein
VTFIEAGVFFSTATLGGGQETTALSCVPFFTHLGMPFVPLGYKNKSLMNLEEIHGGSPYGWFFSLIYVYHGRYLIRHRRGWNTRWYTR